MALICYKIAIKTMQSISRSRRRRKVSEVREILKREVAAEAVNFPIVRRRKCLGFSEEEEDFL